MSIIILKYVSKYKNKLIVIYSASHSTDICNVICYKYSNRNMLLQIVILLHNISLKKCITVFTVFFIIQEWS